MIPKRWFAFVLACCLFLVGCEQQGLANNTTADPILESDTYEEATFAGGCFWCMEKPFDVLPGVIATTSGYSGGKVENPTYRQVSSGSTEHAEAVRVIFDPEKITYPDLLNVFWRNVDPLDEYGQFCDRGSQYRAEIFYHDDEQKQQAEASKAALDESKTLERPISTQIVQVKNFFAAEDYHQNYYQTNPVKYKAYRYACGRDSRLEELWGKK